jgi:autoinducer 2 (AI-2) kinase
MANLEVLQRKGIALPEQLHVCGGQSHSGLWPQILADTVQIPVQTYQTTECTALGAAAMAAFGTGVYRSLTEAVSAFSAEGTLYRPDAGSPYPEIYAAWLRLHRHMIAF